MNYAFRQSISYYIIFDTCVGAELIMGTSPHVFGNLCEQTDSFRRMLLTGVGPGSIAANLIQASGQVVLAGCRVFFLMLVMAKSDSVGLVPFLLIGIDLNLSV